MEFDEHQQNAFDACLNNEFSSIFITGDGGTGKTEIIKRVIKHYANINIKAIVLAPTNSASKNIGGETLHSYFGLSALEQITARKEEDFIIFDNYNDSDDKIDSDDTIMIVDEVSMIGKNVLSKTLNTVKPTKLILLGDLGQLPPPKDRVVRWDKVVEATFKLVVNYRATNPITANYISQYKKSNIINPDIKLFKKSDYKTGTKIIAFTNAELSRLQKVLLGYDNGRINDTCILSGGLSSEGGTIYDNGDEVTLYKVSKFTVDVAQYTSLRIYEVRPPKVLKYPIKVILGDYREYTNLKKKLYKAFREVLLMIMSKYGLKSEKAIWKLYKMDKLEANESRDLSNVFKEYSSIKYTPYARHNDFITTYKAQGKGFKNIAVALYDMPDDKHSYVALSRAIEDIKIIKRRGL